MGLLSTIGSGIKKALDTNLALFAAPITTVTKGVDAGLKKIEGMSWQERTGRILVTAGVAGEAVLAVGTVAGRAAATKVVKSLIPKSTIGKIAAVPTLIYGGAAALGTIKKNPDLPEDIIPTVSDQTKDIYKLTSEPLTVENGIKFLQAHPYLTAATAAAALAAVGYTGIMIANIISNYYGKSKEKITIEQQPSLPTTLSDGGELTSMTPVSGVAAPVKQPSAAPMPQPVTPEIIGVTKTSTKRKKRSHRPVMQPINQRISVIISNSANQRTTKNYISHEVLAV